MAELKAFRTMQEVSEYVHQLETRLEALEPKKAEPAPATPGTDPTPATV